MLSVRAHFDGNQIQLDEPIQLPANAPLLVTVLPSEENGDDWSQISKMALARAYGDDEPEYTTTDLLP